MKKKTALIATEDDLLVDLTFHGVPATLISEFAEKIVRPYYNSNLNAAIQDLIKKAIAEQDFHPIPYHPRQNARNIQPEQRINIVGKTVESYRIVLEEEIHRWGGFAKALRKTGTGDMNILGRAMNLPIVTYDPGDSHLDHTLDEHIDISEYLNAIQVYKETLLRLAELRNNKNGNQQVSS